MKPNEGTTDRIIRLVLAAVLFLLAFTVAGGVWVYVAAGLGAVMLLTAAIGFCPLYALLGIHTCPLPQRKA
ncbi:MAG: DUF2892 domain-containing protein [Meiothermus sp.]|uniref:YgaP family membrane protein n=1 Tax=Meiothermus sp. TaxID=1955249 RepID=UPI0025F2F59B|nr:DUF2892 domain-containing protein [Meiothermus sp.]MCS7068485.1 DUF2892 domain-containing protein [Meiothermus sp.]MCX7601313.1 DUF2892 domain-containing protein [Meiothermus sp.]MDW8425475.1 DUF2892 domain-containing protein [Meiothermus sp.]